MSNRERSRKSNSLRFETLEPRQMLTTFYVDGVNGDDSSAGDSLGSAFQTIQAGASAAGPGDTVLIRGGTYREQVVVPQSGTESEPIVFSAYQGEEVILSGADSVTGWTQHSGDIWVANVNWDAGGNADNNTLFVNGKLKHEARQGAENDILDITDWGVLPRGNLVDNASSMVLPDLAGFGNDYWNGAKIKFHTFDYAFATKTIVDYDSNTGRVTFDSPVAQVAQKQNNGYYIFDTFQALDKPGEWYKEQGNNNLYYHAEPGQNPNSLDIEFKRRAYGIDVSSKDHIHIDGLTFRGQTIDTNSSTDNNVISNNKLYAYDINNYGRFFLEGDNNVFRDNEVSHTWNAFLSVGGERNQIVNNYIHDIGFLGTARAINAAGATELLVSHNTVSKFARSFMDGYPVRSEVAYNIFEDGGRITWDTGVFDSDGGNGNSSYSIVHHNIFRDTDSRGIFEGFYGLNNNLVIHHNVFHDFDGGGRTVLRAAGKDFRQIYHNTVITDAGGAPSGQLDAIDSTLTRYNNNIQISAERMEALGIDVRGNHNYSTSDFINFNAKDFRLAPGSEAIDKGIVIPGINDDYLGTAPDAGAFESGRAAWTAGHNFVNKPTPTYDWSPLAGTNLYTNGFFLQGISDWTIVSGSPNSLDRNSWNLSSGRSSLTGTFRTQSVEFTPNEAIRRTFTDLKPNTTYTLGAHARLITQVTTGHDYDGSLGSVNQRNHRLEDYVTGLTPGEWIRFDGINFGTVGQYDQIDILYNRDIAFGFDRPIDGVTIEIRVGSETGPLLAQFTDPVDNEGNEERWRSNRSDLLASVAGNQSLFVSVSGANAANMGIGSIRLLNSNPSSANRLNVNVESDGAVPVTARLGGADWLDGYDTISFTTGPTATTADVTFQNTGQSNAYLDRIYLIEGTASRGAAAENVSTNGTARYSDSPTTDAPASVVLDGDPSTELATGNHAGSWIQVDLQKLQPIDSIRLTAPGNQPTRLSNFRVSVWDIDPRTGGTEVWSQDYLTNSESLTANEILLLHSNELGRDGETRLGDVEARYVRIQSIGQNNAFNNQLAIGEIEVMGLDRSNLALTDGVASQSSTVPGFGAANANDNDTNSRSATDAGASNSWWQTRFAQPFSIGEIELFNHSGDANNELSNFTVTVWDEDPSEGGSLLWQKSYFSTGGVSPRGSLRIDGAELSDAGTDISSSDTRRLSSLLGKVVRVQLNGQNNAGNGTLSLANVRIASSDVAKPLNNLALAGIATQKNDFYTGGQGIASVANSGSIRPLSDFTSADREFGAWWQVDLQDPKAIDQIVIYNRQDAANRLNNFRVSVWNGNPEQGATELWGRNYFYSSGASPYATSNIGAGGSLTINGNVTSGGLRLDQVTGGQVVRVQLNGTNILSLPEVQVWAPDAELRLDPTATSFNFDLGTPTSPVQIGAANWQRISPNSQGDVWWDRIVDASYDAGSATNDISRDFVTSTDPAVLNVRVPNGLYNVTVNMGDGNSNRDDMAIWAEGLLLDGDVDSSASGSPNPEFVTVDADVEVRDGVLSLRIEDLGDGAGVTPGWVLNRLSLTRVADIAPGPDNALQLLVDADGNGLLRNTTGQPMSLVGYNVMSSAGSLDASRWYGLAAQRYRGTEWTKSSPSANALGESGSAIELAHGSQVYIGKLFDPTIEASPAFQFQTDGGAMVDGYVEITDLALPQLVGDFNKDLKVDAADYTIWRRNENDSTTPFAAADANGDSFVDESDYRFWKSRYGDEIVINSLLGPTVGNGSFEDWGAQNGESRILAINTTETIPGWTATTTGVGGWLRDGDGSFTPGAVGDGDAYLFTAPNVTATLTSDPLSHMALVGEEYTLSLDVGSLNGTDHNFTVSLIFGGQERVIGVFTDTPNVTTDGMTTYQAAYVTTAADAGNMPVIKIVAAASPGLSQAFVDNVRLFSIGGSAPAASLATIQPPAAVQAASPQAIASAEVISAEPVQTVVQRAITQPAILVQAAGIPLATPVPIDLGQPSRLTRDRSFAFAEDSADQSAADEDLFLLLAVNTASSTVNSSPTGDLTVAFNEEHDSTTTDEVFEELASDSAL